MTSVVFYKTNWSDPISVLSYLAHWIKRGKRPRFTHVSLLVGGYNEYHFHYKGVTVNPLVPNMQFYIQQMNWLPLTDEMILYAIQIYNNANVKINLCDALKFITGNYCNTCITFVMTVIGLSPDNITCDELYYFLQQLEQQATKESEATNSSPSFDIKSDDFEFF